MIETFLINDDPDVRQIAEEHQRTEFKFFVLRRNFERRPIRTRRAALEIHADVLERTPNQTGTIKLLRPSAIEMIRSAEVRLNRR